MFPAHHEDDYLKLKTVYLRPWQPALWAAGLEMRGVYACRHKFASWAFAHLLDEPLGVLDADEHIERVAQRQFAITGDQAGA